MKLAAEAGTKIGLDQLAGTGTVDGTLASKLYYPEYTVSTWMQFETTVYGIYVGIHNELVGP